MEMAESANAKAGAWVTVGEYANGWQADLALALLEADGLPGVLENREFVGMNWDLAIAVGWIKLQVPEEIVEAAQLCLTKMDRERKGDLRFSDRALPADQETCLQCGGHLASEASTCLDCGWSYVPEAVSEPAPLHASVNEQDYLVTWPSVWRSWLRWFGLIVLIPAYPLVALVVLIKKVRVLKIFNLDPK